MFIQVANTAATDSKIVGWSGGGAPETTQIKEGIIDLKGNRGRGESGLLRVPGIISEDFTQNADIGPKGAAVSLEKPPGGGASGVL